jgi:hypothetical protein
MRIGRIPAVWDATTHVLLEPVWDSERGRPYLEGFRAKLLRVQDRPAKSLLERMIPSAYFTRLASAASSHFVREGRLKDGELVHYRVCAFPQERPAGRTSPGAFSAVEEVQPLPLDELPIEGFLCRATLRVSEPDDAVEVMPVFLPRHVLEEAERLKLRAGDRETGGVLIGHLHRDARLPEIYVEVTAQIPASHAATSATRLTFTAETWTAVQAAIDLRRKRETMVGWWHTHPAREWCKDCDPSRWIGCSLARAFFSDEDWNLHRTIFPRAFSTALVLGDRVNGERKWESVLQLYGWEMGMVRARPFYVLERSTPPESRAAGQEGGSEDAPSK